MENTIRTIADLELELKDRKRQTTSHQAFKYECLMENIKIAEKTLEYQKQMLNEWLEEEYRYGFLKK